MFSTVLITSIKLDFANCQKKLYITISHKLLVILKYNFHVFYEKKFFQIHSIIRFQVFYFYSLFSCYLVGSTLDKN